MRSSEIDNPRSAHAAALRRRRPNRMVPVVNASTVMMIRLHSETVGIVDISGQGTIFPIEVGIGQLRSQSVDCPRHKFVGHPVLAAVTQSPFGQAASCEAEQLEAKSEQKPTSKAHSLAPPISSTQIHSS